MAKGSCDKAFIWNPSNCECECDKSCNVGEYLDYENCKCRKTIVDKLVEQRTDNIDEMKLATITLAEPENMCKCSCTLYIVLFSIIFTINIRIGTFFVYCKYMNHDKKQLLKKVLFFKQQFTEHIQMNVKSINIKNRTYHFFNDMINIKNFNSNWLKINKKNHTKTLISITFHTLQLKKIDDYENIYGLNPFYLIVYTADGYIEEKNGNKYLTFACTDENKEVLKKDTELWNEIKYLIKTINGVNQLNMEIFCQNYIQFR